MNKKALIIIAAILLMLSVIASIHHVTGQVASVTVDYNVASLASNDIKIDSVIYKPTTSGNQSYTYSLHSGLHHLAISLTGYKPFVVQFSSHPNEQMSINADLSLAADPTIRGAGQISGLAPSYTIGKIKYYYGQTWAVFEVGVNGSDPAAAAANYNPAAAEWQLAAGPGTLFESDDLSGLPPLVQEYFEANGFVDEGSSQ